MNRLPLLRLCALVACLACGLYACAADVPRVAADPGDTAVDSGRPDVRDGRLDVALDTVPDALDPDAPAPDADDDASSDADAAVAADTSDDADISGDIADVADDGDGGATGDVDIDVSADVADAASSDADTTVEPTCPADAGVFSGVLVEDLDGGSLDVGDAVRVTVYVHAPTPSSSPLWLVLRHANLETDRASATLDGAGLSVPGIGDRWQLPLSDTAEHVVTYVATVRSEDALVVVLSALQHTEAGCAEPRSRAGALFQIAGGETKTSSCIDMAEYRSLQVAPVVPRQNTDDYADVNGVRDDLRADGFIFCPQAPTIVHAAEFCLTRSADQRIALSGTHLADGSWEVDDFVLVEVFEDGTRVADGFTTQTHSGGSTFYCGETDTLMCTAGCTAQLIEVATGRALTPIATVSAQGSRPRVFDDGVVALNGLLPSDGTVDVRVTALDTGVEGVLTPALYLVSEPPE